MSMVPGVGILTFPSKAEMRSTFVTSDSPAEVKLLTGLGGRVRIDVSREGVHLSVNRLRAN